MVAKLFLETNNEPLSSDDIDIYRPSRHFNSFVKAKIMEKYPSNWTIDLAGGKGQDLFRHAKFSNNVLYLEMDEKAISQLISRKYN